MRRTFISAGIITVATPALAHPGEHHEVAGWMAAIDHLVSSPFHLALVFGGIAALGAAIEIARRQKRRPGGD